MFDGQSPDFEKWRYPNPNEEANLITKYRRFVAEEFGWTGFYTEMLRQNAAQAVSRIDSIRVHDCKPYYLAAWTAIEDKYFLVGLPPGAVVRNVENEPISTVPDDGQPYYLVHRPIRPCGKWAMQLLYWQRLNGGYPIPTQASLNIKYGQVCRKLQTLYETVDQEKYSFTVDFGDDNVIAGYTQFDYKLRPLLQAQARILFGNKELFADHAERVLWPDLISFVGLYLMAGAFGVFYDEPERVLLSRNQLENILHVPIPNPLANHHS